MAKRITGLGRGMESLLPPDGLRSLTGLGNSGHGENKIPHPSLVAKSVYELPLEQIRTAEAQPRKHFDELTISELAQSIHEHGVLQPILVMPLDAEIESGGQALYRIIAGERRFRASEVLRKKTIPAIIQEAGEVESFEFALIENIQREDLSPIDEAAAYEYLLRTSGLSQQDLAKRLGKGRSAIANSMRLLGLPAEIQQALSEGVIRQGHAKALLMLKDPKQMFELFERVASEGWTVRQVEQYCQDYNQASLEDGQIDFAKGLPNGKQVFLASEADSGGSPQKTKAGKTQKEAWLRSEPSSDSSLQSGDHAGNPSAKPTEDDGAYFALEELSKGMEAALGTRVELEFPNLNFLNGGNSAFTAGIVQLHIETKEQWQNLLKRLGLCTENGK